MKAAPDTAWRRAFEELVLARHGVAAGDLLALPLEEWRRAGLAPHQAADLVTGLEVDVARWLLSLSATTRRGYAGHLETFAGRLGYERARALLAAAAAEPDRVRAAAIAYLETAPLRANTKRMHVGTLERALAELQRRGHAIAPLGVELPARDQDLEAPAASRKAIAQLLEALERDRDPRAPRTLAVVHMALAGLRVHEICALRTGDVDVAARTVRVAGETAPLSVAGATALAAWLARRGAWPGHIFEVTPRTLQRDLSAAARAASGVELNLEQVRRRAILDVYRRRGVHAAARFARVANPGNLKRIILAAGLRYEPDRPPSSTSRSLRGA